jgi:hypothetical protein
MRQQQSLTTENTNQIEWLHDDWSLFFKQGDSLVYFITETDPEWSAHDSSECSTDCLACLTVWTRLMLKYLPAAEAMLMCGGGTLETYRPDEWCDPVWSFC